MRLSTFNSPSAIFSAEFCMQQRFQQRPLGDARYDVIHLVTSGYVNINDLFINI